MNPPVSAEIWLATLALAALLLLGLVWSLVRAARLRAALTQAQTLLAEEQTGHAALRDSLTEAIAARSKAEAQAEAAAAEAERERQRVAQVEERLAETRVAREQADKEALRARTERQEIERRLADWETLRTQSIENAKAATLETANHLLSQYKQETTAAKEVTDKTVKDTTEALRQHFEAVAKSVSVLGNQVAETRGQAEAVMRALSTPGGAGQFGEIGLENTLKAFGLMPGRDFAMQQTMRDEGAGRLLRPDALVFLPGDTVLVIDSKSSKFLLDAARAEGEEQEAAALKNFAQTMRTQLRSLAGKDYKSAVDAAHKRAGRAGRVQRIVSVMCLPTEGALEKLNAIAPTFEDEAQQYDILICGPRGLRALIGLSRWQIDLGLRAENHDAIQKATQQLLESTVTILNRVANVGKGLTKASNDYSALVGSLNSRFLPRAKRLADLGVRPGGHAQLPPKLPEFRVVSMDDSGQIDAERADDAEELPRLPGAGT